MTKKTGATIAYIRVSSEDQNLARQQALAESADRHFEEKKSAGENKERPALRDAIDWCREGDTFVVWSIDRLARSIVDLNSIVSELRAKGVSVHFEKENITFRPGEELDPYAEVVFNMLGTFAQFERKINRMRQLEGIAKAKLAGKYRGQKPKLTEAQVEEVKARVSMKVPKAEVAREFDISRMTLYRVLDGPYMTVEQWQDASRETQSANAL